MVRDVELDFTNGEVTASGDSTTVSVGGGCLMWLYILAKATATGTSPTLDTDIEMSFDGGSTWFDIPGLVPQLNETNFTVGKHIAFPVWIPRANDVPDPRGAQVLTQVRLEYTIGGTDTPTFDILADLRPDMYVERGQVLNPTSAEYGAPDAVRNFAA